MEHPVSPKQAMETAEFAEEERCRITPPRALYDGLLAEVYDDYTDADDRDDLAFWSRLAADCGGAALELACGTGRLLIPMLAEGHRVEGIDNSADMLARCRLLAQEMGVAPVLTHADMTEFALNRRFGLIFCAAGSLTLLAEPGQMEAALDRARAHLAPRGLLALAMDRPGPQATGTVIARDLRRARDGARLRCILDPLPDENTEVTRWRMTNEVVTPNGPTRHDTTEIAFRRPDPKRFVDMLRAQNLRDIRFLDGTGTGPFRAEDGGYVVLARAGRTRVGRI